MGYSQNSMDEHNFTLIKSKEYPEINATAYYYKHNKHGCPFLYIATQDPHNYFSVMFRTTCMDDSGSNHVLEHLVLNGSQKYPIRNIFTELTKQSLSTYMNACTALDWTMYPFSTQNEKDFHNILDVYMDSVFHPLLRKSDFLTECHRLQPSDPDDPNSPLEHAGIVYSEMLGELQQPSEVFSQHLRTNMLPDTPYRYVFGGLPSEIAKLTIEDIRETHKKYYCPSNALFYHYGNFDHSAVLKKVDEVISSIDTKDFTFDRDVLVQPRWSEPKKIQTYGPPDVLSDKKRQYRASVGWIACDISEVDLTSELALLDTILTGSVSAPLYKSLIKSGYAVNFSDSGISTTSRTCVFSISAEGMTKEKANQFGTKVMNELKKIVKKGIDQVHIKGVIHSTELEMKEITAAHGSIIIDNIANYWVHDVDPFSMVTYNDQMKRIKEKLQQNPRFFEDLIQKHLINNMSRCETVYNPQNDYISNLVQEIDPLLKVDNEPQQEAEIPPTEDILPMLTLEDLSIKKEKIQYTKQDNVYTFIRQTNGITYIRIRASVPLNHPKIQYLPLMTCVLSSVGCRDLHDEEFSILEDLYTGGIITQLKVLADAYDNTQIEGIVEISMHCLNENLEKALDLLEGSIFDPHLHNIQTIKTILQSELADRREQMSDTFHTIAAEIAGSEVSRYVALEEMWNGFSFMKYLNSIDDWDEVCRIIQEVYTDIFRKASFECSVHTTEDTIEKVIPQMRDMISKLNDGRKSTEIIEVDTHTKSDSPRRFERDYTIIDRLLADFGKNGNIFLNTDINTSFVAAFITGPSYKTLSSAVRMVLSLLVTGEFLIPIIREEMGAYGANCDHYAFIGAIAMTSFRSSSVQPVIAAMKDSMKKVAEGHIDDRMVEKAIIQAVAIIQSPRSPKSEGLNLFMNKITADDIYERSMNVVNVTKDQIISEASEILNQEWIYAVVGNTESTKCPEGFKVINLDE